MTWFLPTFGRPERCQETLNSIIAAECTTPGVVLIDGCDGYDDIELPPGWTAVKFSDNRGQLVRLNEALAAYPDEPWYGIMHDDFHVVTKHWDQVLVREAGKLGIANANDGWNSSIHGGPQGSIVFGGDLMRAIGWFSPPGIFHMGAEGAWSKIVATFRNWTYCPDTIVEHRHAWNDKAPLDETYRHEYASMEVDRAKWDEFATGPEMRAALERVAKAMGVEIVEIPKGIKLSICTPAPQGKVTIGYVHSREEAQRALIARGIDVMTHWGEDYRSLIKVALDAGATHVACIGADMVWPADLLLQLLGSGHEMCGPNGKFEQASDVDHEFALLTREAASAVMAGAPFEPKGSAQGDIAPPTPLKHPFLETHVEESIAALGRGVAAIHGYDIEGDVAEFGTCSGRTAVGLARHIAYWDGQMPNHRPRNLHLFDSFEGFPVAEHPIDKATPHIVDGRWGPGTAKDLSAEQLLAATSEYLPRGRIKIVPGWYKDTVRGAELPKFALIHIDCDFYGSTMDVLNALFGAGKIAAGALIYFDDWSCNASSPKCGERRAWAECVERFAIHWSDQMNYGIFARCITVHWYSAEANVDRSLQSLPGGQDNYAYTSFAAQGRLIPR